MIVTINLLEVELIHFDIESSEPTESDVVTDCRPSIHGGYSDNQIFVEITINTKVSVKDEVCSITSFSRFDLSSPDTHLLSRVKEQEVIDVIGQLCVMASSHQMGMFRLKTESTNFNDAVIPARSSYEFAKDLKSYFNNQ